MVKIYAIEHTVTGLRFSGLTKTKHFENSSQATYTYNFIQGKYLVYETKEDAEKDIIDHGMSLCKVVEIEVK